MSETKGYSHFLYYVDQTEAETALELLSWGFHVPAHVHACANPLDECVYYIPFTTNGQFSKQGAEALVALATPDACDLNIPNDRENEEDAEVLSYSKSNGLSGQEGVSC